MKKGKNKNRKNKINTPKAEESTKPPNGQKKQDDNVLEGPWINDTIKTEIEKMNTLKKTSDESKTESDLKLYNEQRDKVQSMATAAKMEFIGSQPEGQATAAKAETKNGTDEQK